MNTDCRARRVISAMKVPDIISKHTFSQLALDWIALILQWNRGLYCAVIVLRNYFKEMLGRRVAPYLVQDKEWCLSHGAVTTTGCLQWARAEKHCSESCLLCSCYMWLFLQHQCLSVSVIDRPPARLWPLKARPHSSFYKNLGPDMFGPRETLRFKEVIMQYETTLYNLSSWCFCSKMSKRSHAKIKIVSQAGRDGSAGKKICHTSPMTWVRFRGCTQRQMEKTVYIVVFWPLHAQHGMCTPPTHALYTYTILIDKWSGLFLKFFFLPQTWCYELFASKHL